MQPTKRHLLMRAKGARMVKWVSFLGLGAALCVFSCGCATTAGDIAASQGTLGKGSHPQAEQRLVSMIESGEADRMVVDGKTEKKTYEKGCGDKAVLVTEHRIQGIVYRVEVRNHINPVMDVLTSNVRQVNYGPTDRSLQTENPVERSKVVLTLVNNSYDGQGEIAYRSYIGSDGTFHPVRVTPGDVPDWSDRDAIDLILRTDVWRSGGVIHVRGIRPAGKDRNGRLLEPDGRWLMVTEGVAVTPTRYFVNPQLHPVMKCIACGQVYDTNIFCAP
jgi:hypothetical protein